MVYNVSDGGAFCYVATCNASCQIVVMSEVCATTPGTTTTAITTTTTVSSSTPTPTTSESTTTLDCIYEDPPRKNGETWKVDNCTTAVCSNGLVSNKSTECQEVQKPICASGDEAVKVYDEDGCCFKYECQCMCTVWSAQNYKTFDGKTYNFNKNCTYYLVKESINQYNLSVMVNNHECDPSTGQICQQDVIVEYKNTEVLLTRLISDGTLVNAAFVNGKRVYPTYRNKDVRITATDSVLRLRLKKIDFKVIFKCSTVVIRMGEEFQGKTEGQCGTCDNIQSNDCRSPNGQVEDCQDSAEDWAVPGQDCITTTTVPTTPITTVPPSTTLSTCRPAICDLLTSSVFAPCNEYISPGPFVATCQSDICNYNNHTCESLDAYATECASEGYCIDWRNSTNGQCEIKCPKNQVYKACGTTMEPTCDQRYNDMNQANSTTEEKYEGCFCIEGTTLFNPVHDKCVNACNCVGPEGEPKEVGETWTNNCKECVCDKDTLSVQCEPVQCQIQPTPNCSEAYQLVNRTVDCCTEELCVPKDVCVYNMTVYKPGEKIPTPETPGPTTTTTQPETTSPPGQTTTTAPSGGQTTTTAPSGDNSPIGRTNNDNSTIEDKQRQHHQDKQHNSTIGRTNNHNSTIEDKQQHHQDKQTAPSGETTAPSGQTTTATSSGETTTAPSGQTTTPSGGQTTTTASSGEQTTTAISEQPSGQTTTAPSGQTTTAPSGQTTASGQQQQQHHQDKQQHHQDKQLQQHHQRTNNNSNIRRQNNNSTIRRTNNNSTIRRLNNNSTIRRTQQQQQHHQEDKQQQQHQEAKQQQHHQEDKQQQHIEAKQQQHHQEDKQQQQHHQENKTTTATSGGKTTTAPSGGQTTTAPSGGQQQHHGYNSHQEDKQQQQHLKQQQEDNNNSRRTTTTATSEEKQQQHHQEDKRRQRHHQEDKQQQQHLEEKQQQHHQEDKQQQHHQEDKQQQHHQEDKQQQYHLCLLHHLFTNLGPARSVTVDLIKIPSLG
ncbi:intestinal mucin [Solea senegalensis]|uniref:Intestinal mucin n=1 Tax=Solea senegalensis TaxID=28829 RepID=A0AAV6PKA3_SOLSE|nr:intestinal mucin [Solea senegalensis]